MFDSRSFQDPARLSEHMRIAWDRAVHLFRDDQSSETDTESLREWITEEIGDDSIDPELFERADSAEAADQKIIAFTSRYLGGQNSRLRGEPASPEALARLFAAAGPQWATNPVLSALSTTTVLALRDANYQKHLGADQCAEHKVFAKFADQVDRTDEIVNQLMHNIEIRCREQTAHHRVGRAIQLGVENAREGTRARVHANVLSRRHLVETLNAFPRQPQCPTDWHVALHRYAVTAPPGTPAENILKTLYLHTAAVAMEVHATVVQEFEAANQERLLAAGVHSTPVPAVPEPGDDEDRELARDQRAQLIACLLVVTGVVPYLFGRFFLGNSVLPHSSAVFDEDVVKFGDYAVPYYLFGASAVLLVLGAYLLRPAWSNRRNARRIAALAVAVAIAAFGIGKYMFDNADTANATTLAMSRYPFGETHHQCGPQLSVEVKASEFGAVTDNWQLYLTSSKGHSGPGCDTVVLYRGWKQVGRLALTDGAEFDDGPTGLSLILEGDPPYHGDCVIWDWNPAKAWLSATETSGRTVSVSLAEASTGVMLR